MRIEKNTVECIIEDKLLIQFDGHCVGDGLIYRGMNESNMCTSRSVHNELHNEEENLDIQTIKRHFNINYDSKTFASYSIRFIATHDECKLRILLTAAAADVSVHLFVADAIDLSLQIE